MKKVFKILLKYYLKIITKIVLLVHRPTIIAVAGSTNKNFVKKEIKKHLEEKGLSVRANPKNFNTEIGLPLAILYLKSGYNEYKKWLPCILKAPSVILRRNFPRYLVLSLGTSDEGDMKYLLSVVKPDFSVITDITQRYKEGFADMDDLVREYELLAQKTRKKGVLVLNYDNYRVRRIGENKGQRIVYYGFDPQAQIHIKEAQKTKKGQKVEIDIRGQSLEYSIPKFGTHNIYALAAAIAIKENI